MTFSDNRIEVITEFNADIIKQHVQYPANLHGLHTTLVKDIIHLKEQGVREALIQLGWTPPADSTDKSYCAEHKESRAKGYCSGCANDELKDNQV